MSRRKPTPPTEAIEQARKDHRVRRLYNAVCAWLEADAEARGGEPAPQGDTFTQTETDGRYNPMHMHADHNRQSIDDDDSGAYRLGFNNDHRRKP